MTRSPRLLLLLSLVALLPAVPLAQARPHTLYEKLAYGKTVVLGTCVTEGRFAGIKVDEVLKGELPAPQILIAYRSMNFGRAPGEKPIEFQVGQRSILVIEPDTTESGKVREENRFVLSGGLDGKVDLPEEGSEVLLQAARKLVQVQSQPDQALVWEAERGLLASENYLLVEAGFDEVLKFELGNEAMLPVLQGYFRNPRESFRVGALKVVGQILKSSVRRQAPLADRGAIVQDLLSVARGDASAEVRAQAVRTLREAPRDDLREFFRQVAEADPSQIVRYEARIALSDLGPGPGGSR
jgi:hypothetical protein